MNDTLRLLTAVFKLRIGFAITLSALGGLAIAPGPGANSWQIAVLASAVLLASAAAGAFNQYVERDLDARMTRTRSRPFVTGRLSANGYWLAGITLLLLIAVAGAALALNSLTALLVFFGAFTYGVIYTVWLKRRTPVNIVIGGLAGSFAVLAGAAAVNAELTPPAVILALVLFLWTPPHFWSLAFVYQKDYASAGVPMLPVMVGARTAARIILAHTLALVALSLVPMAYGLGGLYLAGAALGGGYFVTTSLLLVRNPCLQTAMANFHASLIQLLLLLFGTLLDAWLR